MTTAVAAPFRFFALRVARTTRLDASLVRVTFTGEDLQYFFSDGYDQSLSLFLPHPGQSEPRIPYELGDGWWQAWRELPDDVRAVMRSYTLRSLRRDTSGRTTEIDVDFVLHTPAGPASRWAARAAAGDRVVLLGPAIADNRAIRFRAPEDTDLVLLWGDETALPAISSILESLPAGLRVRAWLEVHDAGSVRGLATAADAEITWLVRGEGDHTGAEGDEGSPMALGALRAARLPSAERPYVWIAGESGCVKRLRRHFVGERGIDRRRVTFVGYWRRGLSEEQLREQE
ncbi:siderophore-interacting protein [Streptomyces sp. BK239]|uniref:siderophore-interacting protein n=1 Tax=Streptomyces sp. BK239 TaxID=2512155 RepID=UPI00102AA589|nr:siderophore-interacting protein [Streptomyces sp. BK239]RZU24736.1 NADPH-dependent ferric siderophore reductase [Streptomyces sp. BK239]